MARFNRHFPYGLCLKPIQALSVAIITLCASLIGILISSSLPGRIPHSRGASDRLTTRPVRDAVTPADIVATIYAAMGIPPEMRIDDAFNRPHTLAEGHPITGLL